MEGLEKYNNDWPCLLVSHTTLTVRHVDLSDGPVPCVMCRETSDPSGTAQNVQQNNICTTPLVIGDQICDIIWRDIHELLTKTLLNE